MYQVSHTTRSPREGEEDGVAYNFVSQQQMKEVKMMMMTLMTIGDDDVAQAIANGEFIEHATFAGNTYGTSTLAVERVRDKGDPEMNIDINLHFHINTFASIHP